MKYNDYKVLSESEIIDFMYCGGEVAKRRTMLPEAEVLSPSRNT